jgi:putative membrane protein
MRMLIKWLLVSAVIALSPQVLSDIRVDGFGSALWAAFVYGVLFVLIGWMVRLCVTLLSIVPGILTLGLFFFLVPLISNAILLKLTAGMLGTFDVGSWSSAFVLSLVLTVLGLIVDPAPRKR